MISSISKAFNSAKKEGRPALLTYTVAGDNTKKNSLEILKSISKYADICELGFPHNTPIADGGQIQTCSYRAIKNGTKIKDVLKIVKDFKNILVIEDQMQYNNLYSSISELIINTKNKPNLFQICPTKYELTVGNSQEFFYKKFKMDKISIISKIKKII